jgi:hypothetical protein
MVDVIGEVQSLTPGAKGIYMILAVALVTLIKVWPILSKNKYEADGSLRADLLKRVSQLESDAVQARKDCIEEQEKLHQRIREQDKIIDGLQRQIILFQITVGQALPPDQRSPAINGMLDQLMKLGLDPEGDRV